MSFPTGQLLPRDPASVKHSADVLDSCTFGRPDRSTRINDRRAARARIHITMRTPLAIVSLWLAYCAVVYATALTYRLEAHEKACFFATTEHKGTKLAFYFAVRLS